MTSTIRPRTWRRGSDSSRCPDGRSDAGATGATGAAGAAGATGAAVATGAWGIAAGAWLLRAMRWSLLGFYLQSLVKFDSFIPGKPCSLQKWGSKSGYPGNNCTGDISNNCSYRGFLSKKGSRMMLPWPFSCAGAGHQETQAVLDCPCDAWNAIRRL